MKTTHARKKLRIVLIVLVMLTGVLVLPMIALADETHMEEQYDNATHAEQLAEDTLPFWAWPVIVLGFIIVVAIMAHSVAVGRRKNQTKQT
ncbi:MAG: hypothetical protein HN948_10065 [Clostridia bacterium]|jgi:NADH:ubiquinone oxidoreductase subunit 6 (subunit J)|nr:hypothetical protein [Clostridia bacterium]MBT7123339.1 hypothetical protein [Clostridia bacterium]